MKFDFCIGNPPYQDEVKNEGDRANPLYDKFMDSAFEIADCVELVHPARFLFNAGQTSKAWNKKMLSDPHFKVLFHEIDSSAVFPNTDIKGGVAISLRNSKKKYGAIGTFTVFPELNSILQKSSADLKLKPSMESIIQPQGLYRFSDIFMREHPELNENTGKGTGAKITSKVTSLLDKVFTDSVPTDESEYVQLLSKTSTGKRCFKYVRRDFLQENKYIESFNVFVPESNGSGNLGEVLSTPLIGPPLIGHTDTFLTIGCFSNSKEAESCMKYIKTKYARVMLGILKATQHNSPSTWKYVPIQDFTSSSDIDWSKSIHEIDLQLYKKYNLSEEEINFIETHVKEMK